jgi:tRNA nucleotidyltransferase/poly(A) polymerase
MIEPLTRHSLKECAPQLAAASAERVRDELFEILDGKRPSAALAALFQLGLLQQVIPEVITLAETQQSQPHQFDVWRHTLLTIERLNTIIQIIAPQRHPDLAASPQVGMVVSALSAVRDPLREHAARQWPNNRSHKALLMLAALMHDTGKPATRSLDDTLRIRFLGHEQTGETLASRRASELRLSNDEIQRLTAIVRHHMRPHWLHDSRPLTPRAIYRFWRDTGPAGVDICLLAMADYLGTHGPTLDSRAWVAYLETVQTLLEHYYLRRASTVAPPALITGQTLLDHFGLEPGPRIGALLEAVREAQATGEIATTEEALAWVQRFLEENP